jgi:DHA3 family macrolide efflux protein-like MFS transporter
MVNLMSDFKNLTLPEKNFRGFLWIWATQKISLLGSQIVSFAVIWYLTVESGSTLILALSTIASIVPMILISPFAGVLADKFNKNAILLIADFAQALATAGLILLFSLGIAELWHIIALLFVRGVCQGFQMPVAAAINALMVPEEKINSINAIDQIFNSLLMISTPAIGAYALLVFDIGQIYWLDVFTFIPPALVLLLVRIPAVVKNGGNGEKSSFKKDFGEGLTYIKTSGLVPVFFMFATANFIVVPIFSLFSMLILDHHGGTATQYGWVEIMFHVGLLVGSAVLIISKKKATMKSVMFYAVLLSVSLLGIGLVPAGIWWAFYAACLTLGFILAFIDTQLMSVLQLTVPKELQGRVFSTMFTIIKALNPIGLIIWGIVGEFIPVFWIFILSPIISLVVYFFMLRGTNLLHYGEDLTLDSREMVKSEIPELTSLSESPVVESQ